MRSHLERKPLILYRSLSIFSNHKSCPFHPKDVSIWKQLNSTIWVLKKSWFNVTFVKRYWHLVIQNNSEKECKEISGTGYCWKLVRKLNTGGIRGMKCDHCEKNSDFLVPVKVVDSREVKDLRLCPTCFEIYRSSRCGDNNLQFSSMSYPSFTEGRCKACGSTTKYLQEITLNLANEHRDILLCPSCYKELRFLQEKGDLRDFPPFISGVE